MSWFLGYLVLTFFLNHICAQVHYARANEHPVRSSGIALDAVTLIAVFLRAPFYVFGIVLYSACCLATIVAGLADLIPEHKLTYWIYVLADNVGYAAFAFRAFLVREFPFLSWYSLSAWAFTYRDFYRGNGRIFSFAVQPQNGFRSHDVALECRMRRNM